LDIEQRGRGHVVKFVPYVASDRHHGKKRIAERESFSPVDQEYSLLIGQPPILNERQNNVDKALLVKVASDNVLRRNGYASPLAPSGVTALVRVTISPEKPLVEDRNAAIPSNAWCMMLQIALGFHENTFGYVRDRGGVNGPQADS